MIRLGEFNRLKILREVPFGVYLDDGQEGILLPKRFVPAAAKTGDVVDVFIYHDKEERLIATTQKPIGMVGDIVLLKAISTTPHGAFLDNGLMKDLFVPNAKQIQTMVPGNHYLVKIYVDNHSGRLTATERLDPFLSNEHLTVKELEEVDLIVYRKSEIGYVMIINNKHTGVLHLNEVYRDINIGDKLKGYIKKIYPDHKLDVVIGVPGFRRVEGESEKIIRLLKENKGYLPYHDKSDPAEIYSYFGMSKKAFKMSIGGLYKQQKIVLESAGIRLVEPGL
jgi:predicted RNA-binding protein (virulence factor B family)